MAKNLFEVVQGLFIPFLLLGILFSLIMSLKSEKFRIWILRFMAFLAIFILLISFLRERRLIKYNQINNIYLLLSSIIFGLAFTILSLIKSRKEENSGLLDIFTVSSGIIYVTCNLLYKVPVIFSLPFHFLGMYDSYFSTFYLAKCSGYLFAWIICFLSCWSFYKIYTRSGVKEKNFFLLTIFLVNAFISFVGIVGIINSYYRRKIPIPKGLRKALPQLISAENLAFFILLLALIFITLAFFLYNRKIHGEYSNPAQHRKLKAHARNNRRQAIFTLMLCIFTWIDMTAIKKASNRLVELSPSEEYQIEGNEIFIPLEQISDGHLHRFTWVNDQGKGIRFIVVQKKGTAFGVGFDACDVCGDVGYYERKDEIVCNRCDVVMNKNTIGLKGGCNPVPLFSRIENGGLIVLTDDLQKEAHRFKK
ncbi:MAG: Fe-S-containing protein [Treponema sp.]|nr:Fe-S-containing protein [Treponema sp.]